MLSVALMNTVNSESATPLILVLALSVVLRNIVNLELASPNTLIRVMILYVYQESV